MPSSGAMPEDRCLVALLDDSPSDSDAFRHALISNAMREMLLTQDGGRAILLSGPWGSGKSTVISLLGESLEKADANVKLVIFDAWAHQGDPLRRSFLENAIDSLKPWLENPVKWAKKVDELAKRRQETETNARPTLSLLGAAGAFSILIPPVALQLNGFFNKDGGSNKALWARFLLVAGCAPLGFALFLLCVWAIKWRWGKKVPIPSLIYNATETITTTVVNRTPDPTSIEFENIYCQLMAEVVGNRNRKIVFVIDNLDRVNTAESQAIWATLRIFFDVRLRKENWYKNVWIAVPLDENALVKADPKIGESLRELLQKTFQITFRVPPALTTNWEKFFLSAFAEAFSGHLQSGERRDIVVLYDRLRLDKSTAPTPRQIKIWLNNLGALHRQWRHTVPLRNQAAFLLAMNLKGDNFVSDLQAADADKFLPHAVSDRLEGDWRRDLAAMYFNVEPARAFEALMLAPILNALRGDDETLLEKLEERPGFAEVLERVFESHFSLDAEIEQENLKRACRALSRLKRSPVEYDFCKRMLFSHMEGWNKWSDLDADTVSAMDAVMSMNPNRKVKFLVDAALKSLPTPSLAKLGSPKLEIWTKGMIALLPCFIAREERYLVDHAKVELSDDDYIEMVGCLINQGAERYLIYLQPVQGVGRILETLSKRTEQALWSQHLTLVTLALARIWPAFKWQLLGEALATSLGKEEADDDRSTAQTSCLRSLVEAKLVDFTQLPPELNSAQGLEAYSVVDDRDVDNAAFLALLLLASGVGLANVPSRIYPYGNTVAPIEPPAANDARQRLRTIVEHKTVSAKKMATITIALEMTDLTYWRAIAEQYPDRSEFVWSLCSALHNSGRLASSLSTNELIDNLTFWRNASTDEEFESLITEKSQDGSLQEALQGKPYIQGQDELYRLSLAAVPHSGLELLVTTELREESEDHWFEHLASEDLSRYVLLLMATDHSFGLGLEKAMFRHIQAILDGNPLVAEGVELEKLIPKLDDGSADRLRSKVANYFADGSGTFSSALSRVGDLLASCLLALGPDIAQDRLLGIIDNASSEELSWLAALIKKMGSSGTKARKIRKFLREGFGKKVGAEANTQSGSDALNSFGEELGW